MQHLHNLIARLYPGWPGALSGHRVKIHLADGGTWLHVETDAGLDSPVKPRAVHHLHLSAEWTDGLTLRPVVLLSLVSGPDTLGLLAITPQALAWSYVVTAWNADAQHPAGMRRIWTRAPETGRLVCRQLAAGLAMMREWDREIGRQWQP